VSARSIAEEWSGGELGASQARPPGLRAPLGWLADAIVANGSELRLGAGEQADGSRARSA
jgi:hypothetical protein